MTSFPIRYLLTTSSAYLSSAHRLLNNVRDSQPFVMSPESPLYVPHFTPANYGSFFFAGQCCTSRSSNLRATLTLPVLPQERCVQRALILS
jgi:hypothetical protein